MKKTVLIILSLFTINFAFAFPPLQPYQQGSVNINVPTSWTVQVDEDQGMIYLQENPNDPSGSEIFMIAQQNTNNISPNALIEQTLKEMQGSGFSNISVIESQNIQGGLMTVVSGNLQNQVVKAALVSFANGNFITLAVFNATSQRFDELGGAALIYVTVGGQDPAQYNNASNSQNTNVQNANGAMSPECANPNDFLYDAEHCIYERFMLAGQRQGVDISYLLGQWDFAVSAPSFNSDAWENIATGNISYDGSGKGMSIIFHNNGNYDIIYLQTLSSGGYSNEIKAYEHGTYQYDGLKINLTKIAFEGSISTFGGAPTAMTETGQRIQPESIDVVFINQDELFLQFSCDNRGYIISCNGYNNYLFKLGRKR